MALPGCLLFPLVVAEYNCHRPEGILDKERFDELSFDSMHPAPNTGLEPLTQEEWEEGYHYCCDWDLLFIGPDDNEMTVCTCHPKGGARK